jgi:hypothetical protein
VSDEGELRLWDAQSGASLSPPIRVGAQVAAMHLDEAAQRLFFKVDKQGWYSLPLPAFDAEALPAWFLQLAEALCRRRLSADSRSEDLEIDALLQARSELAQLHTDGAAPQSLRRFADWLLADPRSRALSPMESESLENYLKRLGQSKEEAAAEEVHWLTSP